MEPMRSNPVFATDDPDFVRQLIRDNPWATLVSDNGGELVASHYPVLLDEGAPELTIVTHLGRPDDQVHGLTAGELLVIVQGRHGYVSPSWYPHDSSGVPTWNFSVAHCYGVPEILGDEENLEVLARLVDHFERAVEQPASLDPDQGARIARGTVGVRMPISRFVCKRKLSQNKDMSTRRQVIAALREPGPYGHPELAAEMERALDPPGDPTT
jgi:transcriptional regulator